MARKTRLLPVALCLALIAGCTGPGNSGTPSASQVPPPTAAVPEKHAPTPPVATTAAAPNELPTTPEPVPAPARAKPSKPKRPPEMDRPDALGAMATAGYFLDLYGYAIESGDTAQLEELSTDDCGFCRKTVAQINATYVAGGWQIGGSIIRDDIGVQRDHKGKKRLVAITNMSKKESVVFNKDGFVVEKNDEKHFYLGVHLRLESEIWHVQAVKGNRL